MSRPALLWCKLYSRLLDDDDFRGMSLVQRGVYVGLLCHVSKQEPRGTFSTKNLRDLANVVADGDEDALRSTIDYLEHEWVNAEGEPHLVAEGNRLRFRTFEDLQRAPSEEPEAVKERQDSYKERNNGNKTDDKQNHNGNRTGLEGEGEKEGEKKETTQGVRGESLGADAPVVAFPSDIDPRVFEVLDIFGESRSPDHVKYVALKIVAHPTLNPVAAALETKEHIRKSRRTYKKPLLTWSNWMKNDEKPPPWERSTPASSNGAAPNGSPSLTPEQIAELEDPDHTGRRRTGFWPIPRGTPAPASTVSEWHEAMQWIIDQGRCDRRDLEDSLYRVTPLPPRDGFLPLRLPPESHVINQVKLGLDEQIRGALQKPGLRPHYFVEGERDG